MAETDGFEPPHKYFKGTCLTTWLCLRIPGPEAGVFSLYLQENVVKYS